MIDHVSDDPAPKVQPEPGAAAPDGRAAMGKRLLHIVLVAILMGAAQTVVTVLTVVQFIIMLVDKGQPNEQIAAFGKAMGGWQAKAVRFQTADSEERPWPWSPLH